MPHRSSIQKEKENSGIVERNTDRNVLIIDSHSVLKEGMKSLLTDIGESVSILERREILASFEASMRKSDIIFLGIGSLSLVEIVRIVQRLSEFVKTERIVLYEVCLTRPLIVDSLPEIGGYLAADFDIHDIEQVLADMGRSAVERVKRRVVRIRTAKNTKLSASESDIAAYLLKGLTVSEIAALKNKQVSTISATKRNIFRKMNVRDMEEFREKSKLMGLNEGNAD